MPKYLSGRAKLTSRYTEDRRKYLNLNQAEPSLAIPLSPVGDEGSMPTGDLMQIVSVYGDPDPTNRYWVPFGGGLIPGAISVFEEGSLVGGPSSTTQLDFKGNIVTAIGDNTGLPDPGIAVTVTFAPIGNDHELMFNNDGDFGATSLFVYDNSTVGVASVGIGTSTPSTELHIVGSTRITETIFDYYNNPGNITNILTKGAYGLEWQNAGAVQSGAGGTFYEVQFHGTTGLVDGAPNFVWRNDRVGIGTTLPDRLLDVRGNTIFSGVSTFSQLNPDNLYAGITTFINNVKFDGTTEGKDILWDRNTSVLEFQDHTILGIGSGSDLQLSHDGTVSKIDGGTTYPLQILSDEFVAKNAGSSQTYIAAFHDQGVELFYGGAKKLETVNNGVKIFGTLESDKFNAEEYEADDFVVNKLATITSLDSTYNVLGVTTAGITSVSHLTTEELDVTGIGTLAKLVVDNITIDGNTIESTLGNLVLKVPALATIDIDSITTIDNATDSDYGASTGAFRVVGGASINKRLFVGDDLTVSGVTTLASAGGTTTTGGDLYVNGDIHNTGNIYNEQVSGKYIEATEQLKTLHFEATGISTVGIITATDVGVGGSITVAGLSTFIGVSTFHNDVYFRSTTQSQYLEWSNSTSTLNFGKNAKAVFNDGDGDSDPGLEIYHNGTDSIIEDNGLGELHIKSDSNTIKLLTATADMLGATPGAGISMYYDGGKRLETTGAGVSVIGVTSTSELYVTGFSTFVQEGRFKNDLHVEGDLFLNKDIGAVSGTYQNLTVTVLADLKCDVQFHGSGTDPDIQLEWDKSENYLKAKDDIKFIFGTHSDLEIFHQASDGNTYITNILDSGSTGILKIGSQTGISLGNHDYTKQLAEFGVGAGVTLFYDNSTRIETTNEGISVGGGITAVGGISIGSTPWNDGTGNGDITSDGGDDAIFGIYNKASHDHGRISLIPTSAGGVSTSLLDVQIGTGITAHGDFKPAQTEEYDLGSNEQKWKHLYVKGITVDGAISNDQGAFEFLTVGTALTTQLLHATGITTLGAGLTVTGVSTFNSEVNIFSNLGIGTDNPDVQLDVVGSIRSVVGGYTDDNYATTLTAREDATHTLSLTVNHNSSSIEEVLGTYADVGGSNPRIGIAATSTWNVGIGTNDSENANSSARKLVLYDSTLGHNGLTIFSGTDKTGNIYFGDGFTGTANRMGSITYVHGESGDNPLDNYMRFSTDGNVERLRIDKNGNTTPGATDGSQDFGSQTNRWGTIYGNTLNLTGGTITSDDINVEWLVISGIATITKTDDTIYSGISSGRGEPSETDFEFVNLDNGAGTYNSLHFINGANTDKQGDISFNSINTSDFKSEFAIKQRFSKEGYFERLRIDESGNVGLGTTSPHSKLELVNSDVNLTLYETTSNKSWSVGIDHDPSLFYIKDNKSEGTPNRLVIKNDGFIGVGLDNPTYRLYVEHDGDKVARFIRSDAGNALFYINSQNNSNVILGLGKDTDPDLQYIKSDNGTDNSLIFGVAGSARLNIASDGTVYPNTQKGQDLGKSENRWKTIYAENINTDNAIETNSVKIEYLQVDRITDDNINSGISTFEGNVNVGVGSTTACIDVNYGKLLLRDAAGVRPITSSEDNSVIEASTSTGVGINLGRNSTSITADQELGSIVFHGTPASNVWANSAGIYAKADDTWNTGNYSTYLEFYTTKTSSTVPKARLTIDNSGSVKVCKNDSSLINANDVITQTPLYVEVETDITAVDSKPGIAANGLVRISDTGSGNNRFNGIEIRNTNDGEVRLLNLDAGTSNVSNFVIATDGGDAVGIKERMRVSDDGNVSIGYAGNASDATALNGNDKILAVGEVKTNKINLGSDGVVESQGSLSVQYLNVTGFTTTAALEVVGVTTFKDKTHILSNKNLEIGGNDEDANGKLSIFYNSSDDESVIRTNVADKPLYIRTDKFNVHTKVVDGSSTGNKKLITADSTSTKLYHHDALTLEVKENNVEITGSLNLIGADVATGDITSSGGSDGTFGIYNSLKHTGNITFNIKNKEENYNEALKIHLWNEAGQNVTNGETKSWFDFKGYLRPTVDESYDLGTADKKWNNVHAVTFNGSFQGTATDADDALRAVTATNAKYVATDAIGESINSTHYLTFVGSNNNERNSTDSNISYERLRTDAWLYVEPKDEIFYASAVGLSKLYDADNDPGGLGEVLTVDSQGNAVWSSAQTGSNTTYSLSADGADGGVSTGYGRIKLVGSDNVTTSVDIHAGNNITISDSDDGQFTINAADAPEPAVSNTYELRFSGTNGSSGSGSIYLRRTNNTPADLTPTINIKAGTGIKFTNSDNSGTAQGISIALDGSGSGGALDFLDLDDTPSSYGSSNRGKLVAVQDSSNPTKLVFIDPPESGNADKVKTNKWNDSTGVWQYVTFVGSRSNSYQDLRIPNNNGLRYSEESDTSVSFIKQCAYFCTWGGDYGGYGQIVERRSNGWEWVTPPWNTPGYSEFQSGTRLIFQQSSVPTGWTRESGSAYNNALFYSWNSSSGTSGGSQGATSKLNTDFNAGDRALSAELGAQHKHEAGFPTDHGEGASTQGWPSRGRFNTFRTSDRGPKYGAGTPNTMANGIYLSTGGNNHNHTVSMNIKYLGTSVCKKN